MMVMMMIITLDNSKRYGKGKPIQEIKDNIKFEMDLVRNKWGDLFSSYGRLLTNDELVKFKEAFGRKINDFISHFNFKYQCNNILVKIYFTNVVLVIFLWRDILQQD